MPRNTLQHEGNLVPTNFSCGKSTSSLPKTIVHHEGNLSHASFPSILKINQHMLAHLIAHAQVHCQKQHFPVHEI